jgi:hypothetical protein
LNEMTVSAMNAPRTRVDQCKPKERRRVALE